MRSNVPSCPTHACASSDAIGVDHLPLAERVLLWAIRSWSAYHCDLTAIRSSLDRVFAEAGMAGAAPSFDRMMSALFAGLRRWPDVRCVRCPRLGADELRLLNACGHLQRGEDVSARRALHDWVVRPAVRIACEHAAQFVEFASVAGLQFQLPRRSISTCGIPSSMNMSEMAWKPNSP